MKMPEPKVDVIANRRTRKWSRAELVGRMLWCLLYPLFRISPRPLFWGWRRMLLRMCGAKIGANVHVSPNVLIIIPWNLDIGTDSAIGCRANLYSLGSIKIGKRTTISQGAHLCAGTHDWSDPAFPLLKPTIDIGDDAWICADAFVGPGVTIGNGSIVGARSVVVKDVSSRSIVAGNPAREIRKRPPY